MKTYNYPYSFKKEIPCKDCPDRFPACHDNCESYQQWQSKRKKCLDEIHRQKTIEQECYTNTIKRNKRKGK